MIVDHLPRSGATRTPPLDFRIKRYRDMRVQVMERDDFTCQGCGWTATNVPWVYDGRFTIGPWPHEDERTLHIDHIVPRVHGGPNDPSNLRVLCEPCNVRRGHR